MPLEKLSEYIVLYGKLWEPDSGLERQTVPWSIIDEPGSAYVTGILNGKTTVADMQALTDACISLQEEKGIVAYLIDTRHMEPVFSILNVFQLPAVEYRKRNVDRRTRIAVLYEGTGAAADIVDFYETACRNRGWQAKRFTDKDGAVSWLVE